MAQHPPVLSTQAGEWSLLVEGPLTSDRSCVLPYRYLALALLAQAGVRMATAASSGAARSAIASALPALSDVQRQALEDATGETDHAAMHAVIRFGWPYRAPSPGDRRPTISLMAPDSGLTPGDFEPGSVGSGEFTRGGALIATPSHWSRACLIDAGHPAAAVRVVPFGVDPATFRPIGAAARHHGRAGLDCADDETVFLHMGRTDWASGTDLVLRAFAMLRAQGRRVRLMLVDQSESGGAAADDLLQETGRACPELGRPEVRAGITLLPGTPPPSIYGIADCLVAPCRATAFALPVLEAIACGIPVIVPAGGAADDFFTDAAAADLGWRIAATPGRDDAAGGRSWVEPDLQALVTAMAAIADGQRPDPARSGAARARIVQSFGWDRAASTLLALAAAQEPGGGQDDSRVRVNSFDVFDTLIARRCLEPWQVFEQVGARIGVPGFLQARLAAETQLAGRDYTLDDIYDVLATLWTLTPDQAAAIRAIEVAIEIENVVPVAENLGQVQHGDLLISDMYLSEATIRDLLQAAGLEKRVGLVVSTRGKREGRVWPRIAEHMSITRHLGDDALADVEMPTRFGVPSARTVLASPSPVEAWLMQAAPRVLGLLVREARLRSTHEEPVMRGLQRIQLELNLPILLLSTVQLLRVAREIEADRLLFCSRDCDLWLELFRALPGGHAASIEADYFYTSRIARLRASPDYLDYARERIGARGLLVDACGTGWSASHLLRSLGRMDAHAFFIHRCAPLDLYERSHPTPPGCTIHSVIHPHRPIPNVGIEMINTAEHGSVIDVRRVAGTAVPVLGEGYESATVRRAIAMQRRTFLAALPLLARHDLSPLFDMSSDQIATVVQSLYEHLHAQPELRTVFLSEFRRETRAVHATLDVPLA